MRYFVRKVSLFGVGFASALGFLGQLSTARASFKRVHATACHSPFDSDAAHSTSYASIDDNSSDSLYCYVPSDANLPHASVRTLNVHGYSSQGLSASACATNYTDGQYSCGTSVSGGTGYAGLRNVDVSVWNSNPAGFPYIIVWARPGDQVYGYYLTN